MRAVVVIPVYRDAWRLDRFLPELLSQLRTEGEGVLVRVVDDGSGLVEVGRCREIVGGLQSEHQRLQDMLELPTNVGKGGAIFAGWDEAEDAEWLGFVDADGAVPGTEVLRLLALAKRLGGVDAVIGSRVKMAGRRIERTALRHYVGRVYATLSSVLTGLSVYDSQCGCKFVRATAYRGVRQRLQDRRFGFDMDLLANLVSAGKIIYEEPLNVWTDVPGSKVNLLRDSVNMFSSLVFLRGRLARSGLSTWSGGKREL